MKESNVDPGDVLPELVGFPPVMTLEEVADLLRLNKQVAARLLREHKLPGFRAGGTWRVHRSALQALMTGEWTPAPDAGEDQDSEAGEDQEPGESK